MLSERLCGTVRVFFCFKTFLFSLPMVGLLLSPESDRLNLTSQESKSVVKARIKKKSSQHIFPSISIKGHFGNNEVVHNEFL